MELQEFLHLIRKKSQTIILIVIMAIVFTTTITLLLPLRYEAKSRLLITQNTGTSDAYTLSRSNEYLGNLFSQVIESSSFLDNTLSSNYNVDKTYFEKETSKKMKLWKNTVAAKTYSDSGIIEINIYHTSPYQAQQIALAVNDVMINKGQMYHGGGDNIKINIIDQPIVSSYPVKPNLPTNLLLATILSFIFSLFYVYLLPEKEYDLKLFKSEKDKIKAHRQEQAKAMVWNNLPQEAVYEPTMNTIKPPEPSYQVVNKVKQTEALEGNISNILR